MDNERNELNLNKILFIINTICRVMIISLAIALVIGIPFNIVWNNCIIEIINNTKHVTYPQSVGISYILILTTRL